MANDSKNRFSGITLDKIGKKFKDQWIFRNLNFEFKKGDRISITGYNGSGKSTLLQLIAGYVQPSEGVLNWSGENGNIPDNEIYRHISLAAPYLELIEEFTLAENVDFYFQHKKIYGNHTTKEIIEMAMLESGASKQIKNFSSGMKQRAKLALAFMTDAPVLLLDEPLSNLDDAGYTWYQGLVKDLSGDRIVLVCSNMMKEETFFCTGNLNIQEFKGN